MRDDDKLLVLRLVVAYQREQRYAFWKQYLGRVYWLDSDQIKAVDVASAYRQVKANELVSIDMDDPNADK